MNPQSIPDSGQEQMEQANDADPASGDSWAFAQTLIHSRSNVSSRRLLAPGPGAAQMRELLALAGAAPDHGQLTPWRFVIVPEPERYRLAEAFVLALTDRDLDATAQQIDSAREKAHRAPLLLVAMACLGERDPDIPALERMVSMGAPIQDLLLGAHAMGFGSGLTSGKAMSSDRLRSLLGLGLGQGEQAVCCVNIGNAGPGKKPVQRSRPELSSFVSTLGAR